MDPERLLQPVQQLHAFQTVEAEVTVQTAVKPHPGGPGLPGVQLGVKLPDDVEQGVDGLFGCRRVAARSGHHDLSGSGARAVSAASRVCAISVAMVMGPTPPGTGV